MIKQTPGSWILMILMIDFPIKRNQFFIFFNDEIWWAYSHDIPMTFPWHSHDIPMTFPWHSHDIPMTFPWHSHDGISSRLHASPVSRGSLQAAHLAATGDMPQVTVVDNEGSGWHPKSPFRKKHDQNTFEKHPKTHPKSRSQAKASKT